MNDQETAVVETLRKAIGNAACYFDPEDFEELIVGMARETYGYDDDAEDALKGQQHD